MAEEGLAATRAPAGRDEEVTYEALQDLLRAERRSNKITPIPPRHWAQVREFLQAVTDAFRLEQARDPFGRTVMRLTDEVKNARHAAEAVWALRERKLAMLALAAGREARPPDGITPDEAELYRRLVEGLEAQRAKVFVGLLGPPGPAGPAPTSTAPPAPPAAPPPLQVPIQEPERTAALPMSLPPAAAAPAPAAPSASPSAPSASAPAAPVAVPPDTRQAPAAMVTIRALGDIPPFVGPDMQTYLLKSGDIATVPPSIAHLLVRRNKAAVVDA